MADTKPTLNVDEMQQAGLHFGHSVSKLHPKMKPFVAGIKNNVHIIDLEKSAKELERALHFITKVLSEGKIVLFVGTKIQAKELTKKAAQSLSMPYVTERWLGGTFTNFETIQKRVFHYKDLESKKAKGELEKYTKKERMKFDEELQSLRTKFEGIRDMGSLPEAVLVLDVKKDLACVKEAKKKKITVVGLVDTNIDPSMVDYPILANDDAISSIKYILEKIQEAVARAKA